MVQTFQGYFREGRFVSPQTKVIPENVEVYVVVTNKVVPAAQTKAQKQLQAFDEFTKMVANAEPLCDKFDEIISQGVNLRKELDL